MRYRKQNISAKQGGFTIIELLIATSVLAVILIIVTLILINISSLYDKGVHLANVQDTTRNTIEEIAQDIQLTNGQFVIGTPTSMGTFSPGVSSQSFCIGDTRYSYVVGYAEGTGNDPSNMPRIQHVLWRDTQSTHPESCQALPLDQADPGAADSGNSINGAELVAPGTRITNLSVTQNTSGNYVIKLAEAYGDSDLLQITPPAVTNNPLCKTSIGDQFCSTDSLTLDVTPRITNSGD
jgi:prepilin-type N-terminal cleavage/methylation domain-containing protein